MPNPIQFQEHDFELTEVTFRCQQARLLFRPGDEFNRRFNGCLGQALDKSEGRVRLHFGGSESNHVHLLISARTVEDRARFKCHLRTNLSKEIGDLHDWKEHLFGYCPKWQPTRPPARSGNHVVMTGTGDDSCKAHPLATGYLRSQRSEATMPSPIQFQEHEFELTEVTFRCQQARRLFRPGDEFNRRFNGGFPLRGTVHWTDASLGLSARPSTRAKAASASTSPSPAR